MENSEWKWTDEVMDSIKEMLKDSYMRGFKDGAAQAEKVIKETLYDDRK